MERQIIVLQLTFYLDSPNLKVIHVFHLPLVYSANDKIVECNWKYMENEKILFEP